MCIYANFNNVASNEDTISNVVIDIVNKLERFDGESFLLIMPDELVEGYASPKKGELSIDGVKLTTSSAGNWERNISIKISNYDISRQQLDMEIKVNEGIVKARLELDTSKSKTTKLSDKTDYRPGYYNISAYLDITHLQFIKYTSFTYTPKESA